MLLEMKRQIHSLFFLPLESAARVIVKYRIKYIGLERKLNLKQFLKSYAEDALNA